MATITAEFYPLGIQGAPDSTWSAVGGGFAEVVSDPDDPLGDANKYLSSENPDVIGSSPHRIQYRMTDLQSWGDPPYVWEQNATWTLTVRHRTRTDTGPDAPEFDIWLQNPPGDTSTRFRVHKIVEAWAPNTSGAWTNQSWSFSYTTYSPPGTNPADITDMWSLGIQLVRQKQTGTTKERDLDITWIKLEIDHPDAPPGDQFGTARVPTSAGIGTLTFDTWVPSTDEFYETIDDQRPADDDTSYVVARNDLGETNLRAQGGLSGTNGDEEWLLVRWKQGAANPARLTIALRDDQNENIWPEYDGDDFVWYKQGITDELGWSETWLKLQKKSGVFDGIISYLLEGISPTPDDPVFRFTQVAFTSFGTNNQTVTPTPATARFIALAPQVKADGDGSDDDGEQDPPGITESTPPWIYAAPSQLVNEQTGHQDLAGLQDIINRAPKWIWRATKRLHDDLYRDRALVYDATARFGQPVEGQVMFEGSSTVTGTPADHPIAAATAGGSVAASYQGKIYVVGPQTGSGFGYHYVYDPSDDTWTQLAPVPEISPGNGAYYAIGDRLHFFCTNADTAQAQHYAYTPATDSWDTTSFTPMPTPRVRFASAVSNGRVYLLAGIPVPGPNSNTSSVVECWDSADDSWTRVSDMPLGPRQDAKAVGWGRWVYCFGGFGFIESKQTNEVTADAVKYDTARDTWEVLEPIQHGSADSAVRSPFVEVLNGSIYVCGGIGNLTGVSVLDPNAESWSDGPTMPSGRAGGAVATASGSLWLIRGTSNGTTRIKTTHRLVGAVPLYQATATHLAAPAYLEGDGDENNALFNVTTGTAGNALAFSPGDDVAAKIADASIDWNATLTVYATIMGRGGRVET